MPYATKAWVRKTLDASIEDKQIWGSLATSFPSIGSSWLEADLTAIVQGTGASQRVGRAIRIKSLEIRGVLEGGAVGSAADDFNNVLRCVIATYDGGSTATPLGTAAYGIDAPLNRIGLQYLSKKYYDKYWPVKVAGTTDTALSGYVPGQRHFKYYKRWKNGMLVEYASDTAQYPNKRLVISIKSDSGVIPNPGFTHGYFKMMYEDA